MLRVAPLGRIFISAVLGGSVARLLLDQTLPGHMNLVLRFVISVAVFATLIVLVQVVWNWLSPYPPDR
jgi:hypothetical protein